MDRREFLAGAAALAATATQATGQPAKSQYFELRYYRFNQGDQGRRLNDFASKAMLPLMKKNGFGPTGFFNVVIGPTPMMIGLLSYASMAEREAAWKRLGSDPDFGKAVDALEADALPPFERAESVLLRAAPYSPEPQVFVEAKRPARYFELRTYESDTEKRLRALHARFQDHTVKLFAKHGLGQVFYGEAVIGSGMPCLTYMLVFETWAAREKAWADFGADPDWTKAREASLKDGQVVSRITSWLMRPTAYSPIQ